MVASFPFFIAKKNLKKNVTHLHSLHTVSAGVCMTDRARCLVCVGEPPSGHRERKKGRRESVLSVFFLRPQVRTPILCYTVFFISNTTYILT